MSTLILARIPTEITFASHELRSRRGLKGLERTCEWIEPWVRKTTPLSKAA